MRSWLCGFLSSSLYSSMFLYWALWTCLFDHVKPKLEDSELHVAASFRNSTQLMVRSRSSMCGLILWASCFVILLYLSGRRKKSKSNSSDLLCSLAYRVDGVD